MKYAWIDAQGKAFALNEMCSSLGVSISGYRAWRRGGKPDRQRLTDAQMLALIRAIHTELKGAYGSPCRGANCGRAASRQAGTRGEVDAGERRSRSTQAAPFRTSSRTMA